MFGAQPGYSTVLRRVAFVGLACVAAESRNTRVLSAVGTICTRQNACTLKRNRDACA